MYMLLPANRKINNITGAVYIGSYINIGSRLVDVEIILMSTFNTLLIIISYKTSLTFVAVEVFSEGELTFRRV